MHKPNQLNNFGTNPRLGGAPQRTPQGENSELRGMREPPPVVTFPLPGERERAERLHRICRAIERRRAGGMLVRKAVQYHSWFCKHNPYRTAPHIKARFSSATLVVLYYHWRRSGKSPDCFELHYVTRLAPVTPKQMRRFVRACGNFGTVSFSQAARLAGLNRALACRILSRLPSALAGQIKGIFKERRREELEARAAETAFERKKRRRLAVDAARSRKMQKRAGSFIGRRGHGRVDSTSRQLEPPVQVAGAIFKPVWKGMAK